MGNCSAEENPSFRLLNNKSNQFNYQDDYPSLNISNNIENNNNTKQRSGEGGVYKISRKKKQSNKKLGKFNYFDISPIKDNNTNNSTTSKSKFTDSSYPSFSQGKSLNNIYSNNLMRMNTIESEQSAFSNSNNNDDLYNYNKNFQEKKRLIRRKIHSSDKALEIMTEDTLNKMNQNSYNMNNKNFLSNNNNNLNNNKIATGSYDGTIKIWNLNLSTNNQETIKEEGNVLCLLEFEENMLLSGNNKNNINLWNLKSLKLSFSFKGHKLWVNALTKINNQLFASCSNDNQIRIWDYKNKICTKILNGHLKGIFTLITLKNGYLCSGGADLSIKIWDINCDKCKATLLGHKKWIKCLCELTPNYIISGSDDRSIKLWSNNKCKYTFLGHERSVRTICRVDNNFFVSGSFDKTIRIWDYHNLYCVQIIYAHSDLILITLMISSGQLISCSNDHKIKIWKKFKI